MCFLWISHYFVLIGSFPFFLPSFRRLELPVVMETREELWGCFSWVDIDAPQGIRCLETLKQAGIPALDEAAFAERQRLCREGLAKLADLKEVHY